MVRATTKLFRNNTSQAVRLPKDVAFPEGVSEVEILVSGNARIIIPRGSRMQYYLEHRRGVPDDFMVDREQPEMQEREWWS